MPHTAEMATQLLHEVPAAIGVRVAGRYVAGSGFQVNLIGSGTVVDFGTPDDAVTLICQVATQSCPSDALTRGVATQVAALHTILWMLGSRHQVATLVDLRWSMHPYYRLA